MPIRAAIPRSSRPPAAAMAWLSRHATVSRTAALFLTRCGAASTYPWHHPARAAGRWAHLHRAGRGRGPPCRTAAPTRHPAALRRRRRVHVPLAARRHHPAARVGRRLIPGSSAQSETLLRRQACRGRQCRTPIRAATPLRPSAVVTARVNRCATASRASGPHGNIARSGRRSVGYAHPRGHAAQLPSAGRCRGLVQQIGDRFPHGRLVSDTLRRGLPRMPQCGTPIRAAMPRSSRPPAVVTARVNRYATASRAGA